jgi:hypothetical protein
MTAPATPGQFLRIGDKSHVIHLGLETLPAHRQSVSRVSRLGIEFAGVRDVGSKSVLGPLSPPFAGRLSPRVNPCCKHRAGIFVPLTHTVLHVAKFAHSTHGINRLIRESPFSPGPTTTTTFL